MDGIDLALEPTVKRRSMGSHQSANAGTHTWLTPPEIIEALGPFDLDPCACPEPRRWATAATMWTREDQPLSRAWTGRVWLNPPFNPEKTKTAFMRRIVGHGCGTALLSVRCETEMWFECVWPKATSILFIEGRIHFHHQDGRQAVANSGAPVCLIAYGIEDDYRLRHSGIPGMFIPLKVAA